MMKRSTNAGASRSRLGAVGATRRRTPGFELWLGLHFQEQTAFLNTTDAERMSRKLDGRTGKRIDGDVYMPLRNTAADRAARLSHRHERDGTLFPCDNPSSSMHEFLAAIE